MEEGPKLTARQQQILDLVQSKIARTGAPPTRAEIAGEVSPHTLRHTAAMTLLRAGVDTSTIALWLGHAGTKATQVYLHAHLALKEAALAKLKPYERGKRTRFQPNDRLLAFLEAL